MEDPILGSSFKVNYPLVKSQRVHSPLSNDQ